MSKIAEYKPVVLNRWLEKGERVPPGEIWIFHHPDDGKLEAVDFICPCGCGNHVWTPVTPMSEPKQEHHWQFDEKTTTVFPSIRWLSGCKAHFNITNGKVVWHGDSGK